MDERKIGVLELLQGVLTLVSILRFFVPSINQMYEEGVESMLQNIDFWLLPWALFLNLVGQELKKVKLPKWFPETPVLLICVSIVICGGFGLAHCDATGFRQVVEVVGKYALCNGVMVGVIAIADYSIAHSFVKYKWNGVKAWLVKVADKVFKKRKPEEKAEPAVEEPAVEEEEDAVKES